MLTIAKLVRIVAAGAPTLVEHLAPMTRSLQAAHLLPAEADTPLDTDALEPRMQDDEPRDVDLSAAATLIIAGRC